MERGRRTGLGISLAALVLASSGLWMGSSLRANHPVLVEGEKDFDGDGRLGVDEDNDNATEALGNRIFGTITAALGAANGGANQNGRVTVVSSGRFRETVVITGANGNVTLEAAPGVEANIDAVAAGDAAGNAARQNAPGIIVDAPAMRVITLRNLVVRNWTEGIVVRGDSRVAISNCRIENNRDYGIHVVANGRAAVRGCEVTATGFRVGMGADNTPNPGNGIEFEDAASGSVFNTLVSGSAGAGFANKTSSRRGASVRASHLQLFDNGVDQEGPRSGGNDD
jgi:parallel beta-helix repeat protein